MGCPAMSDDLGRFMAVASAAERPSAEPIGLFLAGGCCAASSLPARGFRSSSRSDWLCESFLCAGACPTILAKDGRKFFGTSSITTNLRRWPNLLAGAGTSLTWSSTSPPFAAGRFFMPSTSLPSLGLSSDESDVDFFRRRNSASTAGGSVGDNNGGITAGGRGFFATGTVGSSLFDLNDALPSSASSRRFLSLSFLAFASSSSARNRFSLSRLSKLKCKGESSGGTNDLADAPSAFVGVPRLLLCAAALGRTPLTESPRDRPVREVLRSGFVAPFRRDLPLGSDDDDGGTPRSSFDEDTPATSRWSRSRDEGGILSLRRGTSSRSRWNRSSARRRSSGRDRFGGRSSSASGIRRLPAGDGGRGGNDAGFGGSLRRRKQNIVNQVRHTLEEHSIRLIAHRDSGAMPSRLGFGFALAEDDSKSLVLVVRLSDRLGS